MSNGWPKSATDKLILFYLYALYTMELNHGQRAEKFFSQGNWRALFPPFHMPSFL